MDKIRISVKKYTYDIIKKDAEAFNFKKKDGNINRNDFINTLIINYSTDYANLNKERNDEIISILDKYTSLKEIDKINLSNELFKELTRFAYLENQKEESIILSLKPTKASETIIEYLISRNIRNQSISSYFREMFDSYANLVQPQRERIMLKNNFDTLNKALEHNRKVFVSLKYKNSRPFTGSIYALGDSKEELFNYCLFDVSGSIQTIRLANIKDIKILNEASEISEELIPLFEYQIENGIENSITSEDLEEVIIKLTAQGKKMFERMYVYRPEAYRIENDYYHFRGSHQRIFLYFKRFGKEAIIISPIYLQEKMLSFHKNGFFSYVRANKKNSI